jgi:uncharacterized membrane protein
LGTSMSYHKLIRRSSFTIVKSVALAIGSAIVATLFFAVSNFGATMNATIMARTEPSLLYFAVAIISGFAVAYAIVRPNLSASMSGVAISVALIPPLAVTGIGLGALITPLPFSWSVVAGSFIMFLVNVAGIVFAGMLSFSLMDVHHKRFVASDEMVKENERIEEEQTKIKEIAEKEEELS